MKLFNCFLFLFCLVNLFVYIIYMGKDKYESKFLKVFDFEIVSR